MCAIPRATCLWIAVCPAIGVAGQSDGPIFSFPDFTNADSLVFVDHAAIVGNVLRVIPATTFVKGAAWFAEPQDVASGFDTWFRFQLNGGSGAGDGFAFVLQNHAENAIGSFGGFLGYGSEGGLNDPCAQLDGIPDSLAIEFDTFNNTAGSWSDLSVPHVSVHSRGAAPNCSDQGSSLGATTAIPNILVGVHTARIRYDGNLLSIFVDNLVVPVLNVPVDLSVYPALPIAWVGFTSGSGVVYRNTDILSWEFGSAGPSTNPEVYCTTKQNSLGCMPHISFTGSPSLSALEEFTVTAMNVRNHRSGLLVWSHTPGQQAFQGGILCVSAPLHRTPLQDSGGNTGTEDCSGTFEFGFSPGYVTAQVGLGTQVFAQYWSRDPYSAPYPVGLTDALSFTLYP